MINPLIDTFNLFKTLVACLPYSVQAFYSLCLLLFVAFVVIHILINIR